MFIYGFAKSSLLLGNFPAMRVGYSIAVGFSLGVVSSCCRAQALGTAVSKQLGYLL